MKINFHSRLYFISNIPAFQEINTWVESQTNSMIKDLVHPDKITDDSRLILVNAVYFKGDWANKFDEANTAKKLFYTTADRHREVSTPFYIYHDIPWYIP